MDIKNVLANSLRRAGYNMQLDTIEKSELYKQAQEILNFMESSFQSNLRFQEAKKIAILQRIDNTHDNFYGDFDRYDIDYEIYSLPEDFLEYIIVFTLERVMYSLMSLLGVHIEMLKNGFKH